MELVNTILTSELATAISYTVLHSLWQGLAIALLMSLFIDQAKSARKRYTIALGSMFMILTIGIVTFCYYYFGISADDYITGTNSNDLLTDITVQNVWASAGSIMTDYGPIIFLVWLLGLGLFFLKLVVGFSYTFYLKEGSSNQHLKYSLSKLKGKLGLHSPVSILESTRVSGPMVVGLLKPVILMPIGILNMLSTEEVEGIIAHELAHVMRNDFAINLIQTFIEAVYYFNPAMWWISANIRAERENCCDDVAIKLGMQPVVYAKSLLKLQELQSKYTPSLAMALASNKGQLINRVKRIMNMSQTKSNMREKSIATLLLITLAVLCSTNMLMGEKSNNKNLSISSIEPSLSVIENLRESNRHLLVQPQVILDTIPESRSSVSVHTQKNGKTMSLVKENGEITELKIDGKVIPESEYDTYKELTDDIIIMDSGDRHIMLFGDGDKSLNFPNEMFDDEKIKEMMKGFGRDFSMPDMQGFHRLNEQFQHFDSEQLEKMMEGFGDDFQFDFDPNSLQEIPQFFDNMKIFSDSMQSFSWDTIIQMGPGGNNTMRFFFDDDNSSIYLDEKSQERERFFDRSSSRNNNTVADILGKELNRDGLLEPFKENRVELTGKHLKINGDKQPKNIWGKYKRIYEEQTGMALLKKSRIDFMVEGKKSNRKIRAF